MRVIKSFTLYDVVYVKYVQKYWIINKQQDVKEGETDNISEAIALAGVLNESLSQMMLEEGE